MEEKRAEREEADKKSDDLLLATDGAKIKFNAHLGKFKVLNDVPTTQGKLTGTVVEKQIPNFTFYDGFKMISLTEWQDFGTALVQDNYVLLKKSKLPGIGKMPGNIPPETGVIEFVDSGQINEPESLIAEGAPIPENNEDKRCYCNRDFTEEEIKNIIVALRKGEIVGYNSKKVKKIVNGKEVVVTEKIPITVYDSPKTRDSLFANQSDVIRSEHISVVDSSYSKITQSFNNIFIRYGINTCIRKIHFIAQTYHESHRFRATFEGRSESNVPKNYKGGFNFQGRGIKQITHDYNYLEYYDFVNGTSLFKDKYGQHKLGEGVSEFVLRVKDKELNSEFINNKLAPFAKKLSSELYHVFNSAGWFWSSRKINSLADTDDVLGVSRKINGASGGIPNGMKERTNYTNNLKKMFNYEKCVNK